MIFHREVIDLVLRKADLSLPKEAKARIIEKMRAASSQEELAIAIEGEIQENKDFVDFARRKCSGKMCAIRDLIDFNLSRKGIEKSLDWVYAKTRKMMVVQMDCPEFYELLNKEISV